MSGGCQNRRVNSIERAPRLTEQATELLRRAIITGDLAAGERYSATELGARMGVSRTPIREAAIELSRLGLVEVEPNKGIRILPTSAGALVRSFEVRLMLEVPLTKKATLRADDEGRARVGAAFEEFRAAAETGEAAPTLAADLAFHTALLALADNATAASLVAQQRNLVLHTGVETVPTSRTAMECFEDHRDIFDAFTAGDADAAAAAMQRHIVGTARLLVAQEARKRPAFDAVDLHDALAWLIG